MSEAPTAFSGSVPENYHRYLAPLIFEYYAVDLATRLLPAVPDGGAILETACGTGVLTALLANAMPTDARLIATDLNPAMLAIAETHLGHHPAQTRLTLQTADATALPFNNATFDAMACQFGVMFYPDKSQGYHEAARVLKPGGTLAFNVWDSLPHNELCHLTHQTATAMFPDEPPAFLETPFHYQDLNAIRTDLHKAGFGAIEFYVLPAVSAAPTTHDAAMALVAGTPLAMQLTGDGQLKAVLDAVENALVDRFGQGPVEAPMRAIAILATRD
ncbi:MAG: class I SAM-dependent methyltransferase [Planctomycetota bacterium]|jgi:ubiquinone/menaquinone biosynthesis C-methylase UbiE